MDGLNDLVEAKVLVPRERLVEFYEWHAQWLRRDKTLLPPTPSSPSATSPDSLEPALPVLGERPWLGKMDGDAIADALNIYERLSVGAKRIIDILVMHPGEKVSGDSLAKQLKLSQAQFTGTLSSVKLRSRTTWRAVPLHYEPGTDGGSYWIEPEVATLFSWARNQPSAITELAERYIDYRERLWGLRDDSRPMRERIWGRKEGSPPPVKESPEEVARQIFLGVEKTGYELEKAFRHAMNLPEPEIPDSQRDSLSQPDSEDAKGVAACEAK